MTKKDGGFFRKDGGLFGKGGRLFFLRFTQVFHDDPHLLLEEGMTVLVVSHCLEFLHEGSVPLHPAVEGLQGSGRAVVRTVELGKLGFGV
jgi:hypothetical protein